MVIKEKPSVISVALPAQLVQPAQWNLCCLYSIGIKRGACLTGMKSLLTLFHQDSEKEVYISLPSKVDIPFKFKYVRRVFRTRINTDFQDNKTRATIIATKPTKKHES